MTNEEVLTIAKQAAISEGWSWKEPIRITKSRRFLFGTTRWIVISNSDKIGANVRVEIDEATGKILSKNYAPR